MYLVAGNAFGARFNRTRFFELITETCETVTIRCGLDQYKPLINSGIQGHPGEKNGTRSHRPDLAQVPHRNQHTSRLILEEQTPRIIQATSDIPHLETKDRQKTNDYRHRSKRKPGEGPDQLRVTIDGLRAHRLNVVVPNNRAVIQSENSLSAREKEGEQTLLMVGRAR